MISTVNLNELSLNKLISIEGGVNWGQLFEGAAIFAGTMLAVASTCISCSCRRGFRRSLGWVYCRNLL